MAATRGEPAPFVVKGQRRNGTITYLCPDAGWALRKLGDFERMGYTAITVAGPDGRTVDAAALKVLASEGRLPEKVEI